MTHQASLRPFPGLPLAASLLLQSCTARLSCTPTMLPPADQMLSLVGHEPLLPLPLTKLPLPCVPAQSATASSWTLQYYPCIMTARLDHDLSLSLTLTLSGLAHTAPCLQDPSRTRDRITKWGTLLRRRLFCGNKAPNLFSTTLFSPQPWCIQEILSCSLQSCHVRTPHKAAIKATPEN